MRTRALFLIFSLIFSARLQAQDSSVSLMFIGDVMGHDTQINGAYDSLTGKYDFNPCFQYIKPILSEPDITIANLEVTLAGKPYKGYPSFSSPDALAVALKNAGVDCLVTANNHSCDRRKKGVVRTIDVLDSLGFSHTGTFRTLEEKKQQQPLILRKNGMRIALLNYTYGTNGIPVPKGTAVNLINKDSIKADLVKAKSMNPDAVIVFTHWGLEYKRKPSKDQVDIYEFCKANGADLVIGSHPHVLQKMEMEKDTVTGKKHLVAYSLGNFVSNQRTEPRDGGAVLRVELVKENGKTRIKDAGYYITWVYNPKVDGRRRFRILPASRYELKEDFFASKAYHDKMMRFINGTRDLFESEKVNIRELE
ncbi:CapA family protein [Fulvitalea axinellae]